MVTVDEQTAIDLASLIHEHQAEVWRYLRYLGASTADADDLTQETFLALARSSFEPRNRNATISYLRTVARNQLLMARRREGREINTVELTAAEEVWAEAVGPAGMERYLAALADCLQAVEGRARKALDMFYHDGRGRAEIAEALAMKPDGVKTLLRRTRDLLRQCIDRAIR